MNQYITGKTIRQLREDKNLTQKQLSELICVSEKTISKWETGKGFPDITLLEPLSKVLNIGVRHVRPSFPSRGKTRTELAVCIRFCRVQKGFWGPCVVSF